MEVRANYVLIGAFTLFLLLSAFGFVLWLANATNGQNKRVPAEIVFTGVVTGLYKGGDVLFNGIKIGEVQDLSFDQKDPQKIIARVGLSPNAPLRQDTKATLGFTGLTGVAHVELSGGSPGAPSLFEGEEIPVIEADRSAVANIVDGAESVINKADSIFSRLDSFFQKGEPALLKSVENVEIFTEALAKNSQDIESFMTAIAKTADVLTKVSGQLGSILQHTDALLMGIQPDRLQEAFESLVTFTKALPTTSDQVAGLIEQAGKTLWELQNVLASVPSEEIKAIVHNLGKTTEGVARQIPVVEATIGDVRAGAAHLKTFSESMAQQEESIDGIVKDFQNFSSRLEGIGKDVAVLLNKINGLVEADGKGFVQQATETLASIKVITDTFAKKSGPIAGGLENFSVNGLRDLQNLITQARQTLDLMNKSLRELNANPQGVLFGAPEGPVYRGR